MIERNSYFKLKEFRNDIVILISIILLPFLFFCYKFVPIEKVWKTNLFVINAGILDDVQYLVWYISVKVLTLFLLILWYITSINNWKNILVFPLFLEIFKLYTIIKSWALNYDYVLTFKEILILITIFLLLILIKNYYTNSSRSLSERMNNQISQYLQSVSSFNHTDYKLINEEFQEIKKVKLKLDKKEYLIKLIELRDKLN